MSACTCLASAFVRSSAWVTRLVEVTKGDVYAVHCDPCRWLTGSWWLSSGDPRRIILGSTPLWRWDLVGRSRLTRLNLAAGRANGMMRWNHFRRGLWVNWGRGISLVWGRRCRPWFLLKLWARARALTPHPGGSTPLSIPLLYPWRMMPGHSPHECVSPCWAPGWAGSRKDELFFRNIMTLKPKIPKSKQATLREQPAPRSQSQGSRRELSLWQTLLLKVRRVLEAQLPDYLKLYDI